MYAYKKCGLAMTDKRSSSNKETESQVQLRKGAKLYDLPRESTWEYFVEVASSEGTTIDGGKGLHLLTKDSYL